MPSTASFHSRNVSRFQQRLLSGPLGYLLTIVIFVSSPVIVYLAVAVPYALVVTVLAFQFGFSLPASIASLISLVLFVVAVLAPVGVWTYLIRPALEEKRDDARNVEAMYRHLFDVSLRLAANPSTDLEMLRRLAKSSHLSVREAVASNPSADAALLRSLLPADQ